MSKILFSTTKFRYWKNNVTIQNPCHSERSEESYPRKECNCDPKRSFALLRMTNLGCVAGVLNKYKLYLFSTPLPSLRGAKRRGNPVNNIRRFSDINSKVRAGKGPGLLRALAMIRKLPEVAEKNRL
jgi:hypothetical protein